MLVTFKNITLKKTRILNPVIDPKGSAGLFLTKHQLTKHKEQITKEIKEKAMVSPLSSRVLNAEAIANIGGSSAYARRPFFREEWQHPVKTKKRISGYSADRSDQESPPCSECSLGKETRANQVAQGAKRRRTEKVDFQAFHARNDLAEAGVNCLPGGSIETDRVGLIVVSRNNPYVNDLQVAHCQDHAVEDANNYESTHMDYMQLLSCAQHFYTSNRPIPTPSEEAANERSNYESFSNTTGSTTPTDYSASEADPAEILPKPLNDAQDDFVSVSEDGISCINSSLSPMAFTLENALLHNQAARLIVEGSISHSIVHSNAAFSLLTGIPSDEIVGNLLKDVLSTSMRKDSHSTVVSFPRKSYKGCPTDFILRTCPIKDNASSRVTHFALDLYAPPNGQMSHGDTAMAVKNEPFNAIG